MEPKQPEQRPFSKQRSEAASKGRRADRKHAIHFHLLVAVKAIRWKITDLFRSSEVIQLLI